MCSKRKVDSAYSKCKKLATEVTGGFIPSLKSIYTLKAHIQNLISWGLLGLFSNTKIFIFFKNVKISIWECEQP